MKMLPSTKNGGQKQKVPLFGGLSVVAFFVLACDAILAVIHMAHFKFCGHTSGPKMGIHMAQ